MKKDTITVCQCYGRLLSPHPREQSREQRKRQLLPQHRCRRLLYAVCCVDARREYGDECDFLFFIFQHTLCAHMC